MCRVADIGTVGDALEIAGVDAQIGERAVVESAELGQNRSREEPLAESIAQTGKESRDVRRACGGKRSSSSGVTRTRETHGHTSFDRGAFPPWAGVFGMCAAISI